MTIGNNKSIFTNVWKNLRSFFTGNKLYDFSVSFSQSPKTIVAFTVFSMLLDGMLLYPAMAAGETDLDTFKQIIAGLVTIASVVVLDVPPSFLGDIVAENRKLRKKLNKAYPALAVIMLVLVAWLYYTDCSLKTQAAMLSAQTSVSATNGFTDSEDNISVIQTEEEKKEEEQADAQLATQKAKIAVKRARVENIIPIADSVFLFLLSAAGADKRRRIRLTNLKQSLLEERDQIAEKIVQYRGLPTEEQLLLVDSKAMKDMEDKIGVYIHSWKRDVLFPAVAQLENPYYAADMLRAADMDVVNSKQIGQ